MLTVPEGAAGGHGFADPAGAGPPEPDPAEIELWRRIDGAGIKLMRIPTPFAVGRVNCWLIEDEPLTLIDSGPNSGTALDELSRQLDALGHAVDEIGLIVVSHQHIDHIGLVDVIARRSGAEVAAVDALVPFLEGYRERADADDEFAAELMLQHGIPEQVVVALRSVSAGFRGWGAGAHVDRTLRDGELLELRDRTLEVQLRPGHSPTDTLFWDAERRILIGADHLLEHISSNPLLARPADGGGERPHSLLDYSRASRARASSRPRSSCRATASPSPSTASSSTRAFGCTVAEPTSSCD